MTLPAQGHTAGRCRPRGHQLLLCPQPSGPRPRGRAGAGARCPAPREGIAPHGARREKVGIQSPVCAEGLRLSYCHSQKPVSRTVMRRGPAGFEVFPLKGVQRPQNIHRHPRVHARTRTHTHKLTLTHTHMLPSHHFLPPPPSPPLSWLHPAPPHCLFSIPATKVTPRTMTLNSQWLPSQRAWVRVC